MSKSDAVAGVPFSTPFYYGWFIVALSFFANLTAVGIRSAPSVLIHPLEAEFGWSRTAIASAASLNLLLLGLFAPVGGWLIDRVGPRRVILGCLTTIAMGLVGTVFVQQLWQLVLLWGVVLGIATGVTPALGASIASRWFVHRRGLAIGIMTNASAAGQVVYLPLLMAIIISSGWRTALVAMSLASAVLIPVIWFWMRDNPAEVGLEPYRSANALNASELSSRYARGDIRPISISAISEVFKTSTFWILSGCFFYLRRDRQRPDRYASNSARDRKRDSATHRGGGGNHGWRQRCFGAETGRQNFRPGFCLSSTWRRVDGDSRWLGARAFRRLSNRFSGWRLSGLDCRLPGVDGSVDRAAGARDPCRYGTCESVIQ